MPANQEIAEKLREIYNLMQLAGENRFRAIAFDRAAQAIENLKEPVSHYIENENLTDLDGIGKSIAGDIYIYAKTGTMPVLADLKERVPRELIAWLDISGLGPKNILKIHQELGITTIGELKSACEDGRVAGLPGMGEKSAQKIIRSIDWLQQFSKRCLLSEGLEVAEPIKAFLEKQPGVRQVELAGSLRRSRETIGDIDILAGAEKKDVPAIFDAFTSHDLVVEILGRGDTKCSVRTGKGRQIDLRIVTPKQFPAALLYFTGSKEHNVTLRQRARSLRIALNEYGLFRLTADGETDFKRPVDFTSEADIYQKLGLSYIPPELREDRSEYRQFEQQSPPLLEEIDIKGVIHAHSTWSDGKQSIEEMARAAFDKGYQYLGITDHSRTAAYAGGLSVEDVQRQWDEIWSLNEQLAEEGIPFTIFRGIESDILADGSLDYPDEILEGFDFVIASVHSGLDLPLNIMMERFRKAIEHPSTSIIGHPSGRLLLRRGESKLDMNQMIEWAILHNTAIEINANPWRLDMDWRYGEKAGDTGLLTSVNPDAHSVAAIDHIRYGVKIARKAGFEPGRVINTLSAEEFGKWLESGN